MKKLLLSFIMVAFVASLTTAQTTIFEDFDSYTPGDQLHTVSQNFELWPGTTVGHTISDVQSASPNNSVYLFSNTGGGPGDLIMNFGDRYDSGTASLSFNMYVSPGFGGYYNIQAERTAGITWASQVFFNANGTVEFQNSNNTVAASATYPQGEWFEVRYDVNLTENIWELSLGGRCLASYANPANSFASFNLYPVANGSNAEFWFDDMRFEHMPSAQGVSRDVSLANGDENVVGLEGNQFSNVAVMINNLGEPVTSAVIQVNYPGSDQTLTYDNINVAEGDSLQIVVNDPIIIEAGVTEMQVSIVSINGEEGDDVRCNNSLFRAVTAVTPTPRKGVLAEEATGTWCPQCPRGAVTMEMMEERYGQFFVGIAVHNGDPMVVSDYDSGMSTIPGFTGYPNISINRGTAFVPGNSIIGVETPFIDIIDEPIRSAFNIGAQLNDATNELDISIEVEGISSLDVFDKLVVAIVEDHVTGTASGYAQANANSGTDIPYGGLNLLPSPIPASDMVYDDVARALLTPFTGMGLDADISAGSSKIYNFRVTLDSSWDQENLLITTFLLDSSNAVDNAMESPLADAIDRGFSTVSVNDEALQSSFEIFPNPVADLMSVKLDVLETGDVTLELFNIYGQLVQTEKLQSYVGTQNWIINVADLQNGMYTARVRIGEKTAVQKVQKLTK